VPRNVSQPRVARPGADEIHRAFGFHAHSLSSPARRQTGRPGRLRSL